MNINSIEILTFVSVSLLAAYAVATLHEMYFGYRSEIRARLKEIASRPGQKVKLSPLFKDLKKYKNDASAGSSGWRLHAQTWIEQSGLALTLSTLAAFSLASGVISATAATLAGWRFGWWAGACGFALGMVLPSIYVHWRRKARIHRFSLQLPEAFDAMSRAIRAGQSLTAAFQMVAEDFPSPIKDEFQSCYEQQNLGVSSETALRTLGRRTGILELQMLVVALLLHGRCGGNLVELLQNLSRLVRSRLGLRDRVKALTGEGRMQAAVLVVLPLVAFAALLCLAPDYVACLLDRPWLLAGTAAAQLVGAIWIRRIVNFDF